MMKISFENTDEDAVAWNHLRLTKTVAGRKAQKRARIVTALFQALIGVIGYMVFCGLTGLSVDLAFLLLCTVLAGGFGYGAQFLKFRRIVRRQVKSLKKNGFFAQFLGPKEVTVSPEGLRTSWTEGEFLRRWGSAIRVEETEAHLLFVYGDADFSIIPKRAFASAAHQQEFITAVERFKSGAVTISTHVIQSSGISTSAPWWRNRSVLEAKDETPVVHRRF